jgi:hypothetical protein
MEQHLQVYVAKQLSALRGGAAVPAGEVPAGGLEGLGQGLQCYTCLRGVDQDGETVFNIRASLRHHGKPRYDCVGVATDGGGAERKYARVLGFFRCAAGAAGAFDGALVQWLGRAPKPRGGNRVNVIPLPYVAAGEYYTGRSPVDASLECIELQAIVAPVHVVSDHDNKHHYYVNDRLFMFDNTECTLHASMVS